MSSGLPVLLRLAGRPAILVGTGETAEAKRRLLERAGAVIVGEESEAAIAIVATEAPDAVAARLRARGVLVNVADRPELCDFTLPAIVDRDPVLIAVSTGGTSAGLSAALRQALETLVPTTLGKLAKQLFETRTALRTLYPTTDARREALAEALAPGGPLDPLADQPDDAVARWLAAPSTAQPAELVTLRLTSPDPEELSLRQARLLARAARLYHRPDVPTEILNRARADAPRICSVPPVDPGPGLSLDLEMAG